MSQAGVKRTTSRSTSDGNVVDVANRGCQWFWYEYSPASGAVPSSFSEDKCRVPTEMRVVPMVLWFFELGPSLPRGHSASKSIACCRLLVVAMRCVCVTQFPGKHSATNTNACIANITLHHMLRIMKYQLVGLHSTISNYSRTFHSWLSKPILSATPRISLTIYKLMTKSFLFIFLLGRWWQNHNQVVMLYVSLHFGRCGMCKAMTRFNTSLRNTLCDKFCSMSW